MHLEINASDGLAHRTFGAEFISIIYWQRGQRFTHRIEAGSQVDERAEHHVAGNATEWIKMKMVHAMMIGGIGSVRK